MGIALACAGVIYQGIFRNPMADPYIIGVSAGASLGATIGLILVSGIKLLSLSTASLLAFAGAIGVTFLVYNISRIRSRISVVTLLLAGVAISALINSINSFILIFRSQDLAKVIFWLMGGLTSASWQQFFIIAPVIVVLLIISSFFMNDLNLISLSDERASQLGVDTEKVKKILLVLASLIAAAAVSVSGIIGFVGLVTPHIMRLISGPDHKSLFPASAVMGGIILLFSDTIARTLLEPREIPVGIITSIIGVPFFIYLCLLRIKKRSVLKITLALKKILTRKNILDTENILKVENLNFAYDGKPVLNDLSFTVRKGSFISILGPNGSGKSTLINLLSKVLKGYTGRIEVFGKDLKNLNSAKHIQTYFSSSAIFKPRV